MNLFALIMSFVIHFALCFLLTYSCEEVNLWGNLDKPPELFMPKLKDVDLNKYKSDSLKLDSLQKYVDEEIVTSIRYFDLHNEIKKMLDDASNSFGMCFILQLSSLAVTTYLFNIVSGFNWILSLLITAAICSLGCFITYTIYKHTNLKFSEIKFSNYREETHNFSWISTHYRYLLRIKDSVRLRFYLRKILGAVAAVTYILIFPIENI